MFRRERDTRRVVKTTRDHAETMAAFGRASYRNAINSDSRTLASLRTMWKQPYSEDTFKVSLSKKERKSTEKSLKNVLKQTKKLENHL